MYKTKYTYTSIHGIDSSDTSLYVQLIGLDVNIPSNQYFIVLSGERGKNVIRVFRWVFTSVSFINPRHLQRAQRQHLASQVSPLLLLPLFIVLCSPIGVLPLYPDLPAASDSDLMVFLKACP